MERHGGDLIRSLECSPVQCFDIVEDLLEFEPTGRHGAAGEAVEHEGVVGIRTVGDGNVHGRTLVVVVFHFCVWLRSASDHDRQTEQRDRDRRREANVGAERHDWLGQFLNLGALNDRLGL